MALLVRVITVPTLDLASQHFELISDFEGFSDQLSGVFIIEWMVDDDLKRMMRGDLIRGAMAGGYRLPTA